MNGDSGLELSSSNLRKTLSSQKIFYYVIIYQGLVK